VNDEQWQKFTGNRKREFNIKIDSAIPVEIDYRTIVVENNQIAVFPDIYHRGSNSLKNLKIALATACINYDELSQQHQLALMNALDSNDHSLHSIDLIDGNASTQELASNR
jgi:hypothetical protein